MSSSGTLISALQAFSCPFFMSFTEILIAFGLIPYTTAINPPAEAKPHTRRKRFTPIAQAMKLILCYSVESLNARQTP